MAVCNSAFAFEGLLVPKHGLDVKVEMSVKNMVVLALY